MGFVAFTSIGSTATASGATSANLFTTTPAAGDVVIVGLNDYTATSGDFTALAGIADGRGWFFLGKIYSGTGVLSLWWCYANGTGNTISATSPSGAVYRIEGQEWNGYVPSAASFVSNDATGGSSAPTVTINAPANSAVVEFVTENNGSSTLTGPSSPWTNSTAASKAGSGYQVVSSAGNVTGLWSLSANHSWNAAAVYMLPGITLISQPSAAGTGQTTLSVIPSTVGNLEFFGLSTPSGATLVAADYPIAASGGGVTTWTPVPNTPSVGSGSANSCAGFWGTVTSTGASTITTSGSSSNWTAGNETLFMLEFNPGSSSPAGWDLVTSAAGNNGSNVASPITGPTLSPAAGQLAIGVMCNGGAGVTGTTTGYTYIAVASKLSVAYDPSATAGPASPTWTFSGSHSYADFGVLFSFSYAGSISNGSAASDSLARLGSYPRAISDGAAAADSTSKVLHRSLFLTDGAAAAESLGRVLTRSQALTDGAAAAGSVVAHHTVPRSISNGAAASDSVARLAMLYARAIADGSSATGALARVAIHPRGIANGAAAGDTLASRRTAGRTFAEGALATDALFRRVSRFITNGAAASDSVLRFRNLGRSLFEGARAGGFLGVPIYVPVVIHFPADSQPNQRVIVKASVFSPEGTWLTDLVLSAGSITVDETQQVRRKATLTIPSRGLAFDDLVPVNAGDLLHPASMNELKLYRGWQFLDGSQLLYPQGVFRTSTPAVSDTGDSILIGLNGLDRSSVISRQTWQAPYSIASGTNLGTAVEGVLNDRWPSALPPLVFNFAPTALTVPATVFGANPGSQNDPFADALSLAIAAGMELFFDVNGHVVMRPVPDPTTAPVLWKYMEGDGGSAPVPFNAAGRTLDETSTYNGVQAIGNAVAGSPVQVTVWDTDPDSPTYYLGDWGQTPFQLTTSLIPAPGQSTPAAEAQLTAMAQAQLQLILGVLDDTTFTAVPNPAMVEGDCLQLVRARIGIDDTYVASSFNMPLDVGTLMTVANRPRRQTT